MRPAYCAVDGYFASRHISIPHACTLLLTYQDVRFRLSSRGGALRSKHI